MSTQTFELKAESNGLPPFRKKLQSLLQSAHFNEKSVHEVLLSVDEVLTNVIRHAYRNQASNKMHVTVSLLEDRVEIAIQDEGPCFDPRTIPAPELPREKPGGLGIYLVRSLMDEIEYEPLSPRGNRLRLVKFKMKKEKNQKP